MTAKKEFERSWYYIRRSQVAAIRQMAADSEDSASRIVRRLLDSALQEALQTS